MRTYIVMGYDKRTGEKKVIEVEASTSRHAKSIAYDVLTRPRIVDHVPRRFRNDR